MRHIHDIADEVDELHDRCRHRAGAPARAALRARRPVMFAVSEGMD
jgi:hypothetical protein